MRYPKYFIFKCVEGPELDMQFECQDSAVFSNMTDYHLSCDPYCQRRSLSTGTIQLKYSQKLSEDKNSITPCRNYNSEELIDRIIYPVKLTENWNPFTDSNSCWKETDYREFRQPGALILSYSDINQCLPIRGILETVFSEDRIKLIFNDAVYNAEHYPQLQGYDNFYDPILDKPETDASGNRLLKSVMAKFFPVVGNDEDEYYGPTFDTRAVRASKIPPYRGTLTWVLDGTSICFERRRDTLTKPVKFDFFAVMNTTELKNAYCGKPFVFRYEAVRKSNYDYQIIKRIALVKIYPIF